MMRTFIGIAVLVGLVTPCSATSYRVLLLPELVGRADVIVIGTVTKAEKVYHIKVTATLVGTAGGELTFPKWADTRCKVNDSHVFFLVTRKEGLSLIYPFAYVSPDRSEEVRRLVDMKTNPKKYLDDPTKQTDTLAFLEILGYAFAGRDKVGSLTKADAVEHLRQRLTSDDKKVVLQAITGLERTGSKQAALSVIPLLRHPSKEVRLAAVKFLEWSADKRAVAPLCKALDEIKKNEELGHFIGRALGTIGDPAAAPALERAVKRGIGGWTGWALGTLGGSSCFEILLERVEKHDSMDAEGGLEVLIHRSNKKPEPWMKECTWTEETGLKNKDKWRKWWNANKSDFKVIKTAAEAFGSHK